MDKTEKIQKLKERAGVSYEEAMQALEQTDHDLLDAFVLLEKQGKVEEPEQTTYSTRYEAQKEYIRVVDKVEEQKQSAPTPGKSIGRLVHLVIDFIRHSTFNISRDEKILFSLPTFIALIVILIFWKIAVPVMLIAMLFRIRYSFTMEEEGYESSGTAEAANGILGKAGDIAQDFGDGLRRNRNE